MRYTFLFSLECNSLSSSCSSNCTSCCISASTDSPQSTNTVPSPGPFRAYTSIVPNNQLLCQCSSPPPHPRLQTSYLPTLPSMTPLLLAAFLCPLLPLPFLTRSGFCNKTQEVFVPEVLNPFTFLRSFLSILSVSRNSISTLLHFSQFLDTLSAIGSHSLPVSFQLTRTLAVV